MAVEMYWKKYVYRTRVVRLIFLLLFHETDDMVVVRIHVHIARPK